MMTDAERDRIIANLPKCPKCGETMHSPAPECFYCKRGRKVVDHGFTSVLSDGHE